MTQPTADVIDLLAGIAPGSPLDTIRARRPEARVNAQRSFAALLEPATPGAFPLVDRYVVAAFVAGLHGFDRATAFYADLLADEADAAVLEALHRSVAQAAAAGPAGSYREPGLAAESTVAAVWTPEASEADVFGARLTAALVHAHLLVLRPREASPDAVRALVDAGWDADGIVTLSQLVAFLSFQLRSAWALSVLQSAPVPVEGVLR